MDQTKQRTFFYLSILWAIVLSVVTCVALPQQFLTADILMQSVMSLQKLTLYYWGQNRLINVLPLAAAWITDPRANLMATLFLAAMSFYLLLLALSRFAAAAVNAARADALALKTFVLASTVFVCCFSPRAIFEITIAHFEYALPALLLAIAVQFSLLGAGSSRRASALAVLAVIVAIGLNPTIVIPGLFVPAALALYRGKVGRREIMFAGLCLSAYLGWSFVAAGHGNSDYTAFDPSILPAGVVKVVSAMLNALNLLGLLLVVGALALGRVFGLAFKRKADDRGNESVGAYLCQCALAFSVAWLLLFSSSRWVESNLFSWRYFTFVFFAALLCLSIALARLLDSIGRWPSLAAAAGAAAMSLFAIYLPPLAFEEYRVFRETRALSPPGSRLYAGDYWLVWPSVLRDMMQGHESYGLAFRGEANRQAVRAYVRRMIARDGHVAVLCLVDTPVECKRQIAALAGDVQVSEPVRVRENVHELRLSAAAGGLDYSARSFLALPSQVGTVESGMKKTDGRPGFLVFGPYASLDAGNYRLTVFGSSDSVAGAFADVASAGGHTVHAKFALQPGAGNTLLRDADLSIPEDTSSVEVRVWVSEGSRLGMSGYRLERR